jgi:hypothetical protein
LIDMADEPAIMAAGGGHTSMMWTNQPETRALSIADGPAGPVEAVEGSSTVGKRIGQSPSPRSSLRRQ